MIGKLLNRKTWLGYTLYFILLTVVFLNYRFPSEALRDSLRSATEGINPELLLSIQKISPFLPYGLKFEQTEFSSKGGPSGVLFKADSLFVRPVVWSFLQGEFHYRFDGRAYDGYLRGGIQFPKRHLEAPFTTTIELKDIHIGKRLSFGGALGQYLEGSLSGTFRYRGNNGSAGKGAGEAELTISDGRVALLQGQFQMESIAFSDLRVKAALKNQSINLTQVALKGREIQATLSGTIILKKDLSKSMLNLRGSIEPLAGFFQKIKGARDTIQYFKQRMKRGRLPFTVRGTISEPKWLFT